MSSSESLGFELNSETGTLIIWKANVSHEGTYQCSADNQFGMAVGDKILVRMAGNVGP